MVIAVNGHEDPLVPGNAAVEFNGELVGNAFVDTVASPAHRRLVRVQLHLVAAVRRGRRRRACDEVFTARRRRMRH